ncbi:hypothetical protein ACFX58_11155 [Sphingomonas sp. NCPPB 2930]
MSVNRELPHVLVLPEDGADREIANGFLMSLSLRHPHRIDILLSAGGWPAVRDSLAKQYIAYLRKYVYAHLVLLIDFDNKVQQRWSQFTPHIPADVKDRVYLVGALDEPEKLRRALNWALTREAIGKTLADECANGTGQLWQHPHMAHNANERQRLIAQVHPILF